MLNIKKKWGSEKIIVNNEKYCGKILSLKKDYYCSFHYHKLKDETFYILKGEIIMSVEGEQKVMKKGDVRHISPGTRHRFEGITNAEILEISTQHFEHDSYRLSLSGKR